MLGSVKLKFNNSSCIVRLVQIIGLNPPFGVMANNFIDWTLKFRPKIVLLIVPEETKR